MTCQSFTSVSLDPPLVAFLPMKTSRAFAAIRKSRRFCVNFLAAEQAEVSNTFASLAEDKFADVTGNRRATGCRASTASSAGSTAWCKTCTRPATTTS